MYWKQLESEFDTAASRGESRGTRFQSMNQQFVRKLRDLLQFTPAVQIDASPFVSAQIARVDGKLHVFLANFGGLQSKVSAQQIPERNVRIAFPSTAGTRIFLAAVHGRCARTASGASRGQARLYDSGDHEGRGGLGTVALHHCEASKPTSVGLVQRKWSRIPGTQVAIMEA
jgi:hypothetical protein